MSDFSLLGNARFIEEGGISGVGNSTLVKVTAPTANVKTSWQEIIAVTAQETSEILFSFVGSASVVSLFDVAVGGAGSEEIIIENISIGPSNSGFTTFYYSLPINIAAGSRLSFRGQTSGNGFDIALSAHLFSKSFVQLEPVQKISTYGISAAGSPYGTSIDAGSTVNTKGAWVELTSSSDGGSFAFLGISINNNFIQQDIAFLFDIAIGGSGSEEIIVEDITIGTDVRETIYRTSAVFPVAIPEGARVAVRSQADNNDALDRVLDVGLYIGN